MGRLHALTIYAIQVTDAREIPVALLPAQYHNRFELQEETK
jgi:hypothetical protein